MYYSQADLVVYIQQSNRMIRQLRMLFTTVSRMRRILYENINSPLKLARFVAETPTIGLGDGDDSSSGGGVAPTGLAPGSSTGVSAAKEELEEDEGAAAKGCLSPSSFLPFFLLFLGLFRV
jgi:hypothetical protein